MSAAVGIRATGDAALTSAGVFSSNNAVATQVRNKPVLAGSTVIQITGPDDLNAVAALQGGPQWNPYVEVQSFIAEMANKLGVAPMAAAARIQLLIRSIYLQTSS